MSKYVALGEVMKPCAGLLPSDVLALNEVSNTSTAYHTGGLTVKEYRWNQTVTNTTGAQTEIGRLNGTRGPLEFPFNIQGQKWIRDIRPTFSGPQEYGGVKNCATPRRFSAAGVGLSNEPFPHIQEFETYLTGISFTLVFMNLGGNNSSGKYGGAVDMYIEQDGEMFWASSRPKTTVRTSGEASYLNVVFNKWQNRTRIRFCLGGAGFIGIRTSSKTILSATPNRLVVGFESDSYGESSQALCADNVTQFNTGTIANFGFRRTQLCIPQFGQGATGFNSNGAGQVFDDTVGTASQLFLFFTITITGLTRYFSGSGAGVSSRRAWLNDANTAIQAMGKPAFHQYSGEFFNGPLGLRPLALMVLGTWNDRSSGILNPVTYQQMYDRVSDCWDWVHSIDEHCKIAHISPEPFDDGFFNTNDGVGQIGPPKYNDPMTRAQKQSAAERDWVHYVDAYNPENPWWTGMGPATLDEGGAFNTPTNSQQAQLVSAVDSIHGKWEMQEYLANKIFDSISDMPVLKERVEGRI